MKNTSTFIRFFAVLLFVLGMSTALRAQLPENNDAWKMRCNLLAASERLKRLQIKASGLTGKPLTSTPAETSAVIDASTTMPLTLKPAVMTARR